MEQFKKDYFELLRKYNNREWNNLDQKRKWKIQLEVFEELDERLEKDRIRKLMIEKYFNQEIN